MGSQNCVWKEVMNMPQFYTVKTGDTLSTIATEQGTTVENLLALNQISDPDMIFPGQTLVISADGVETGRQGRNANSRVIDGLLYTIVTNKRTYSRGESVNITLVKTNTSSRPRSLFYTTSQRFDFQAVRTDGTVVWRWSRDRSFTQRGSTVTLQPGESQVFNATWDQRNQQGNLVTPQEINIRGFNWAQGLRTQSVSVGIVITRAGTTTPPTTIRPTIPPPSGCRPGVNLLANAGFEVWPNPDAPPSGWQGENVSRQEFIRHMGRYSARLGANPTRRASLSQTISAAGGRIYRLAYWIREIPQVPPGSNFRFNVRIFFYNSAGRLISTADPEYTEVSVPESFIQFNFTTGLSPAQTSRLEVRFIFTPESGNNNPIALDDVFLECLR
jgi:LysM repeat protein